MRIRHSICEQGKVVLEEQCFVVLSLLGAENSFIGVNMLALV